MSPPVASKLPESWWVSQHGSERRKGKALVPVSIHTHTGFCCCWSHPRGISEVCATQDPILRAGVVTPPKAKDVPQRTGGETEEIEKCGGHILQSRVGISGAEDEGGWQKGRTGGRGRLRPMPSLERLAPEASRWGFLNLGRDH